MANKATRLLTRLSVQLGEAVLFVAVLFVLSVGEPVLADGLGGHGGHSGGGHHGDHYGGVGHHDVDETHTGVMDHHDVHDFHGDYHFHGSTFYYPYHSSFYYPYRNYCDPYSVYHDPRYCYRPYAGGGSYLPAQPVPSQGFADGKGLRAPLLSSTDAPEALPDVGP